MTVFYDLSQRIETGMTVFPGDPAVRVQPADAAASPWLVSRLDMGTHSGTHIDAASHFIRGGKSIDQYTVDRFVLVGVVVPALGLGEDDSIEEQLEDASLVKGGGVIIRTDWSQYWGTERYLCHPYLSAAAAARLAAAEVGLVAIDALNVDSTVQETSHAHQILLGQDIVIVENLAHLAQLEMGKVYQFSFLPLLLTGLDGSPVRAVAWEPIPGRASIQSSGC